MIVANLIMKTIEKKHWNKWLEINTVFRLSKASQTFMFKKVLISIQNTNNGIMWYSTWLYGQIKLAFSLEDEYFTTGVRRLKKKSYNYYNVVVHLCQPVTTAIYIYKSATVSRSPPKIGFHCVVDLWHLWYKTSLHHHLYHYTYVWNLVKISMWILHSQKHDLDFCSSLSPSGQIWDKKRERIIKMELNKHKRTTYCMCSKDIFYTPWIGEASNSTQRDEEISTSL